MLFEPGGVSSGNIKRGLPIGNPARDGVRIAIFDMLFDTDFSLFSSIVTHVASFEDNRSFGGRISEGFCCCTSLSRGAGANEDDERF